MRALVVDDSLVYLRIMGDVLEQVGGITRVFRAGNAEEAQQILRTRQIDVAFLDIEMPGVDGLELLSRIKRRYEDLDVVMVSGKKGTGIDQTVRALQLGALAYIDKPIESGFEKSVKCLCRDLKPIICTIKERKANARRSELFDTPLPGVPSVKPEIPVLRRKDFWVVLVGVSTGGPEALSAMIPHLPTSFPLPIVVVQHMPEGFTEPFANSLDAKSQLRVKEASSGETLEAGKIYIAPGGIHSKLVKVGGDTIIRFVDSPPENSVKPAVDVLFRSASELEDKRPILGVVMTGMGEDGRRGMENLKRSGCYCITQSQETCVVYGMPRAVDEAGLTDESVKLEDIAGRLQELALGTGVLS